MMLSNFLFRVRQWAYENRARLIRILLTVAAILALVFLIFAAVEKIQSWRYEKRVQALEKQFNDADAKAKAAEARAAKLEFEIDARKAELKDLQLRADAADAALKTAQGKTKILKEVYENTRIVPVPFTPISCPDACTEIERLVGYSCK